MEQKTTSTTTMHHACLPGGSLNRIPDEGALGSSEVHETSPKAGDFAWGIEGHWEEAGSCKGQRNCECSPLADKNFGGPMGYSEGECTQLFEEHRRTLTSLQDLLMRCVLASQSTDNTQAKEHLLHGAGRRIGVLRKAVENIFDIFPPTTIRRLPSEILMDVQINLHAFVINACGVFDNFARAYYYRHDLKLKVQDIHQIGLFTSVMNPLLPKIVREYVSSDSIGKWQKDYLKNYRDALAHRIPLYIPPASFTQDVALKDEMLEAEKAEARAAKDFAREEEIWTEQESLGEASLYFLHSYTEEGALKPLKLHPQILADSNTVLSIGNLFFSHWHECP